MKFNLESIDFLSKNKILVLMSLSKNKIYNIKFNKLIKDYDNIIINGNVCNSDENIIFLKELLKNKQIKYVLSDKDFFL